MGAAFVSVFICSAVYHFMKNCQIEVGFNSVL
jgi:hypothetical protein